jgi:RNA-directed DNA polymerase
MITRDTLDRFKAILQYCPNLKEVIDSGFFHTKTSHYYLSHTVRKSSGGLRWINAPQPPLIDAQTYLLHNFFYKFKPSKHCVGFRRGMGVTEGAKRHFGNKCLLNLDLKDFFPSIHRQEVYQMIQRYNAVLRKKGFSPMTNFEIGSLTKMVTLSSCLPQGAPTSPVIANLVSTSLDKELSQLSDKYGLVYTRYADDLSFSSPDKDFDMESLIPAIILIVEAKGRILNNKKTRISRPHQRMEVTGVVINDRLTVPRYKWRNFRAKLHNLIRDRRTITPKEYKQLRGYIQWIQSIHPEKGKKFLKQLGKIPINQP